MVVLADEAKGEPPAGFRESTRLSPIASEVTGRPVMIWCARTPAVWRDTVEPFRLPWLVNGYAMLDEPAAYLAPTVCRTLEGWLRGKSAPIPEHLGREILMLVHAAIHLRGVIDESETECAALALVPGVARASFRVRSTKILRTIVWAAQVAHNGSPAKFRGTC